MPPLHQLSPTPALNLPPVMFGTMTFGAEADQAQSREMVDHCIERGVRWFDTANVYNDGRSEQLLGEAIRRHREPIFISTKVRFSPDRDDPNAPPGSAGLSRDSIREALHASLTRLGVERIDLYFLHAPDYNVPIEETLGVLSDLRDEGKIAHIGVSKHAAWQLAVLQAEAARTGAPQVAAAQTLYNVVSRNVEHEFLDASVALGVATIAYNPLAGGLLSGKHEHLERTSIARGRRFTQHPWYQDRYLQPGLIEAVRRLDALARASGMGLLELSLRWLASQARVTSVLLGASTVSQITENLAAFEKGQLPQDVLVRCDEIVNEILGGCVPAYWSPPDPPAT